MGSTPTTGTDIKPQKAQSFLGSFFGMVTGVEQGGTAKPRTKVSGGDFCGPRPHHRLTKQPGTAACICGGSGLLLYLFTLQLSTCRYGFLECLMPFCCNRVRRKWRCRCAQWWRPRGWHRGNPRSCPWKGYPFWRSHNGGQQLLPAVPAFG